MDWIGCSPHIPQARFIGDGVSSELQRSGHILLRNSHYRFFQPHYSGEPHDKRQVQIVTEGQHQLKTSSVLGIGRSDLESYGVEDQFSHSVYDGRYQRPPEDGGCEGLHEKTHPGRYTPRKQLLSSGIPPTDHTLRRSMRMEPISVPHTHTHTHASGPPGSGGGGGGGGYPGGGGGPMSAMPPRPPPTGASGRGATGSGRPPATATQRREAQSDADAIAALRNL